MCGNREEPRFIVVLVNWIATGICGFEGLIQGAAFLASVYYLIIFHLGWSTLYIPPWEIFITLARAVLYLASAVGLIAWMRAGGIFGLIANSTSLLMLYTEYVFSPETMRAHTFEALAVAVPASIAIILILLLWDHLCENHLGQKNLSC